MAPLQYDKLQEKVKESLKKLPQSFTQEYNDIVSGIEADKHEQVKKHLAKIEKEEKTLAQKKRKSHP